MSRLIVDCVIRERDDIPMLPNDSDSKLLELEEKINRLPKIVQVRDFKDQNDQVCGLKLYDSSGIARGWGITEETPTSNNSDDPISTGELHKEEDCTLEGFEYSGTFTNERFKLLKLLWSKNNQQDDATSNNASTNNNTNNNSGTAPEPASSQTTQEPNEVSFSLEDRNRLIEIEKTMKNMSDQFNLMTKK